MPKKRPTDKKFFAAHTGVSGADFVDFVVDQAHPRRKLIITLEPVRSLVVSGYTVYGEVPDPDMDAIVFWLAK